MNELTLENSAPSNRYISFSIASSVLSGLLWFVIEGPLPVHIDYIDPAGYTYLAAVIFGMTGGLAAILVTAKRLTKKEPYPIGARVALALGVTALGWNAFFLWLFLSWATSCTDGPCY